MTMLFFNVRSRIGEILAGPSTVTVGNSFSVEVPTGVNVGDVSEVLAVLMFRTIGSGDAGIGLSQVSMVNSIPKLIDLDSDPAVGDITVTPVATPVPEPSTLGLFGIGLAATADISVVRRGCQTGLLKLFLQ